MTAFGKLLVFLNLFVAVALVTWATSLTANRLDWVDRQDGDAKIEGEISRLTKEIVAAKKAVTETTAVYGRAETALATAESGIDPGQEGRDRRRAVFATRLEAARNGRFRDQRLQPGKVFIDVVQEGDAAKGPDGEPLEGIAVYQKRLDDAFKDSTEFAKQVAQSRAQYADLSAQIGDTNERVAAQRTVLANLADEQKFLGSLQINWDEDLRTLKTRERQLDRRLQQIKARQVSGKSGL